jgi:uncharacterized protein YbcC (UPF0753/DUF2309 family)
MKDREEAVTRGSTVSPPRPYAGDSQGAQLLRKKELRYQSLLLEELGSVGRVVGREDPIAQVVFCIDVRSEGFRRHLESVGPFETFGFAGFFALPVRFLRWGSTESVALCPVIVNPTAEVKEEPRSTELHQAERMIAGRQALGAARSAFDGAKNNPVSSFLLAEAGGIFAAPATLLRTAFPRLYARLRSKISGLIEHPVSVPISLVDSQGMLSHEEQVLFAESALRSMGLTQGFAPVVLLCGHGSTTENNPYASSLDCGACAGNRGGASARAAAVILNSHAVRAELRDRGIAIPSGTVFLAGEHDTALDTVSLSDDNVVPASVQPIVERLMQGLDEAGRLLNAERVRSFPGFRRSDYQREVAVRSSDWAQVRPEWGLARNASFIVAPRSMTSGADLGCRSFLHSYDPSNDDDGGVLEAILTGPMVVAHWINMQYYFSSVDPEIYSSGDKTLHNVVGGVGVVSGVGGDLRSGLPIQSVFGDDGLYHEPLRLLVVIEAPRERIDAVFERNPVLRNLLRGEWIFVVARESEDDPWWTSERGSGWERWQSTRVSQGRSA